MQNSITVTSQSPDEERDQRPWKVALLAVVGVGTTLLATYALIAYLEWATPNLLYVVGGAALLSLSIFILQGFFVKTPMLLRTLVFVETVAPLLLFTDRLYPAPSAILIAAAGVFFFFANMGSLRALRQAAAHMRIHFFDIARAVIPKALTGGLLFMAALVYLTYFSWGTLNDAVGRKFVNQALSSSDPILRLYFSRVSVDQKVEEFLREVVRAELEGEDNNIIGKLAPDSGEAQKVFRELPVPERDVIVARVTEGFRKSLEPIVGPLNPEESVRDAVYRIIEQRFAGLTPSQRTTFSVGGLVLVFFALKGFLSLFHWLIAAVAYLIFKLCMALGFARKGVATQTREFVILS